jgi:hypothetical protein
MFLWRVLPGLAEGLIKPDKVSKRAAVATLHRREVCYFAANACGSSPLLKAISQ